MKVRGDVHRWLGRYGMGGLRVEHRNHKVFEVVHQVVFLSLAPLQRGQHTSLRCGSVDEKDQAFKVAL